MDKSILWDLSYGLYAIGTMNGNLPTGCIVNTVFQITSDPAVIALGLNKNNFTHQAIKEQGRFAVSVLAEQCNRNIIAKLGFTSGKNTKKFDETLFEWTLFDQLPVVTEGVCGFLSADVISFTDTGTHDIIIARVNDAKKVADLLPLTYKYYHDVIKGKTPKNAPTYQEK